MNPVITRFPVSPEIGVFQEMFWDPTSSGRIIHGSEYPPVNPDGSIAVMAISSSFEDDVPVLFLNA
jgi:predicted TIM-barrel fold metal-dependent hydrolase